MRKALKRARRTLRTYRDSFGNIVRGSRESLERLAQPEVSDEPRETADAPPRERRQKSNGGQWYTRLTGRQRLRQIIIR